MGSKARRREEGHAKRRAGWRGGEGPLGDDLRTTSTGRVASGSLAQYLNVRYSERLPPSSAVDEIEDTIAKFIPEGYYTDEQKFLERVEHDAVNFKPFGEKIYSYSRTAMPVSKGKNVAISQVLSPEDQETVDYEVYHVSQPYPFPLFSGALGSSLVWSGVCLDRYLAEPSHLRPDPTNWRHHLRDMSRPGRLRVSRPS